MEELELYFINTPGHGYLVVPDILLWTYDEERDLWNGISSCSYRHRNGFVYLEEDCDAPFFVWAMAKKGFKVMYRGADTDALPNGVRLFETHQKARESKLLAEYKSTGETS